MWWFYQGVLISRKPVSFTWELTSPCTAVCSILDLSRLVLREFEFSLSLGIVYLLLELCVPVNCDLHFCSEFPPHELASHKTILTVASWAFLSLTGRLDPYTLGKGWIWN